VVDTLRRPLTYARVVGVTGGAQRELSGIEHQLAVAQAITHMGSWQWDPATNVVTWSDELYRIYGLEPGSVEITFESFLSRVHPDDRAHIQANVGAALQRGGRFAYRERIIRPDGSIRHLDTVGEVLTADGKPAGLLGTCRDVTDETRARKLQADEHNVLEMIATAAPLREILTTLVIAIEDHAPPTIGSILLMDDDGKRVRHAAAPSLPRAFVEAIDGAPIGPSAGSCGTAAFLRTPVFVEDIATDPLWADYRALAVPLGLRACWSTPLFATDGRVLGTFALYYREPRRPTEDDVRLIERAGHLAAIAIERRQLEDQLRALSAHVESIREDERSGIAREIHDELGQSLTALRMDIAWVGRRLSVAEPPREAIHEKLASMAQLVDTIVDQVRRISAELRPGVLDDLGLIAAIEWQCQQFQERTGTACLFRAKPPVQQVERNLSTAVFRILQEALTNVVRHAEADQVEVALTGDGSTLRLEVHDNGKGLTPDIAYAPGSLGLLGIRERARQLGGTVSFAGHDGTTVTLTVPLGAR
jgi:PAS domain S-box-containing protein